MPTSRLRCGILTSTSVNVRFVFRVCRRDLTSRISTVETLEGKLILQGTDAGLNDETDGGGWTMAINQMYGSMILTVAGHEVAFVGMGACIPNR